MRKLGLLLLINCAFLTLSAQNPEKKIIIRDTKQIHDISEQLELFTDSENRFESEKPAKTGKYSPNSHKLLNFSGKNHATWVRFTIKNESDQALFLQIPYVGLDTLHYFYSDKNNQTKVLKEGHFLPFSAKKFAFNDHIFPLELSKNETKTFYIRAVSVRNINAPFLVGNWQKITTGISDRTVFEGAYFGFMLMMVLYHLVLYYRIRERTYLVYSLHSALLALLLGAFKGYAFSWFWPDFPIANYFLPTLSAFAAFASILFSRQLLNTRKNAPKLNKGLNIMIGLFVVVIILNFAGFYTFTAVFIQLLALINSVYLVGIGVYLYRKGDKTAKFYLLAWGFYFAGLILAILQINNIVPYNLLTRNGIQIGSVLEILMFSLAMADRINRLKESETASRKELITSLKENKNLVESQNEKLEQKVMLRTQELLERNEEINQQNEELTSISEQMREQNKLVMLQNTELNTQKEVIESAHGNIKASINYARRIQNAILPRNEHLADLLPQSFVLWKPRDIVSGDFYWCTYLKDAKENRKTVFVTADCTGHGVPGAFMSMIGANILSQIINDKKISDPAFILELMHAGVRALLQQNDGSNNDGMDAAVCTIDTDAGILDFSGAKRPLLIFRNSKLEQHKGDSLSVGGGQVRKAGRFTKKTFRFSEEEPLMIYTFTDGYPDQFGGPNDRKFMTKNFRKLVAEIADNSMREQEMILRQTLQNWQGDSPQQDDILVVGIRLEKTKNLQ